jgi:hypothetical protein
MSARSTAPCVSAKSIDPAKMQTLRHLGNQVNSVFNADVRRKKLAAVLEDARRAFDEADSEFRRRFDALRRDVSALPPSFYEVVK